MKFILGVNCVPNKECFVLFFPKCIKTLVFMNRNYGGVTLIRGGKYGIGDMNKNLDTPRKYRSNWWV